MTLNLGGAPHDSDDIQDLWYALQEVGIIDPDGDSSTISTSGFQEAPAYGQTPYGATKTAELNVQFAIDPSFGLSEERYGWYSDGVFLDDTNITEANGRLKLETNAADGASNVRLRSSYPGQYIAHTISEPGLGAEIDPSNIERDADNLVSLTHGEISLELGSIDTATQTGINAHGISYESDATYHQVRVDQQDVLKTPQKDWNIDTMDGSGDLDNPSGLKLTPEDGYVYQFIYSWYGEGAMILALQDPDNGIIPLNSYVPNESEGRPPLSSPNLPIQVTVLNKGTADSLSVTVGGMQYATHGKGDIKTTTRTTEEARVTGGGFISDQVTLTDESVDPFNSTLSPLVAARRNSELTVQKSLRFEVDNVLLDCQSDVYAFIFDEFRPGDSGLDGTFSPPKSKGATTRESRILTNTTATTYSPTTDSVLRGFVFIPSSKNDPALIVGGDASSRIPLRSTVIIAAALAPGENATAATPALVKFLEGF